MINKIKIYQFTLHFELLQIQKVSLSKTNMLTVLQFVTFLGFLNYAFEYTLYYSNNI